MKLRHLAAAVLALVALALPASAAYVRVHADAADMAVIDSGAPDKNNTTDAVGKLLVNYCNGEVTSKGLTVVLLRIPEAVLATDAADLARADLVFAVPRARNWDPSVFTPVLAPLDESYVAAEATWNQPYDGATWAVEGAKVLETSIAGTYREQSATLSFDLRPLLADPDAATALAANGAAIRLAWTELPEAASFAMLQLSSTAEASAAIPDVYFVLAAPAPDPTIPPAQRSYIDSGKPDTNFGDSASTLGKCLVVFNPGEGEARSLLKFAPPFFDFDPAQQAACLLSIPYYREWPAEDEAEEDNSLVLNPLTTPFRMDQTTWNKADNDTTWTTPGGDYDASVAVNAAIDRDAQVATFDLTALFRDPATLANLHDNGALVRLGNAQHPVESGSIGFNFFDHAPETELVEADSPEFVAVSTALDTETGTIRLDLTGLDPRQDYELWGCSDLVARDWAYICDVPDSGVVLQPLPAASTFYRVQLRQDQQ